jgi:Protein of unknown function (DUF3800)
MRLSAVELLKLIATREYYLVQKRDDWNRDDIRIRREDGGPAKIENYPYRINQFPSMQSIYNDFQNLLASDNDTGMVIVDSRVKHLNTPVAHAIFTRKFKSSGDNYDRILELPAFSHSENHAGLQLADKLSSALIFPLAVHSYCEGQIQSVHVRPPYADLKQLYR